MTSTVGHKGLQANKALPPYFLLISFVCFLVCISEWGCNAHAETYYAAAKVGQKGDPVFGQWQ